MLWYKLSDLEYDERNALYAQAILMPDEDFDIRRAADTLSKPDWEKTMGTDVTVTRLRARRRGCFSAPRTRPSMSA